MKNLLIILLIFFTASCSSNVKGSWSCPVLEGGKGHCVSISDADSFNLANNNTILPESYFDKQQKIEITLVAPKLKDLKKLTNEAQPLKHSQTNPTAQLRTEERVGKIWFAPYIDADANQHSESVIYVVDEKAKWVSQR